MEGPIQSSETVQDISGNVLTCTEGYVDTKDDQGDVNDSVKLKRSLSLFDGVMLNVGIMIGTGIFISPKGVLAGVESVGATLCVWVGTGILSLLGALCYAELGTMIPAAGGTYTYTRVIFGDLAGFLQLWASTVIVSPAGNAVIALLFSIYCLEPFYPDPDCPPPKIAVKLLAVLCTMITMFVNCWSVRISSLVQNILSVCKLLAIGIIIISGLVKIRKGHTEHFKDPFASTAISGLGTAIYSCFFSYSGWSSVSVLTEELKNPMKNLPIAIVLSVLIVSLVNTLANVAYFSTLSPSELLGSDAVALTYAEQVLGRFSVIIPLSVALSSFGSLNGCILSNSRKLFAGAREGHVPTIMAMIGIRHKTPLLCIITSSTAAIAFCFVDNVFFLINLFGFIYWIFFGTAVAGLLYMRVKEPNLPRPFKVNIVIPIIFITVCMFLTVLGFIGAPLDSLIATAIVLSGIPVYFLMVRINHQLKWIFDVKRKTTEFLQRVMFIAPEEDSNTS